MTQKDFFGRQLELNELMTRIFKPQDSGPASASLTGPPGIGKRALLREATNAFEAENHPGVFLIEREFRKEDTQGRLLWDLLNRLREALTETALKALPAFTQTSLDKLNGAFQDAEKSNPYTSQYPDWVAANLNQTFRKVMEACGELNIRVILILDAFDTVMDMEERDRRGIVGFLDSISMARLNDWNLSTLLVSEMQPQFIASRILSGSRFEDAYPSIPLYNFNDDEMALYFGSLPGGAPDKAVREALLRHCGRYPKFLMEFRESVSAQRTVSEEQVCAYAANKTANRARRNFFHRLRTLLKTQSVTTDNLSALDVFQKYFLEKDNRLKFVMEDVYMLGLADKRPDGTYTPLTEYCDAPGASESSFLSYLRMETPLKSGVSAADDSVIASWLHLSDLHVSDEPDTRSLLRQFEALSKVIHPDFLIVTGDFRDKAKGTDFSGAEKYLNKILEHFHISKANTYLVPGNHDAEDAAPKVEKIIQSITRNMDEDEDYYCYQQHLETLYGRFSAFDSFCMKFYANIQDERFHNPCKTKLLVWNGKLNLLCVNTALISDGKRNDKGERLHGEITDLTGLEAALEGRNQSAPTIMIGHHALTSLYQSHIERIEEFFKVYDISVYLHGDIHKHNEETGPRRSPNRVCSCLSCGKSAPKSSDNYSDVGAVYYEWRNDGRIYVKWYKWYGGHGARTLKEDNQFSPGVGQDYSFEIIPPPKT